MIFRKAFIDADPNTIPKDSEYRECNFMRSQPASTNPGRGVRLWPGDDTPRVFIDCNMMNCEPPPGSTYIRCNSYMMERSIPAHTDELVVDGVQVSFTQYHDKRLWGRWDTDINGYVDIAPVQSPEDY